MALIKPPLAPVLPGMPITASAWNAAATGIEQLRVALGGLGREYVEVTLRWRGGLVRDAQVVGIPLDGGASCAAVPTAGAATHAVVGVRKGRWRIAVQASGFAPETRDVDLTELKADGPSAAVSFDLVRSALPMPELVGLSADAANYTVHWGRLGWDPYGFDSVPFTPGANAAVVMQSPSGGQVDPTIRILAFQSFAVRPSRALVPDFLGFPARDALRYAAGFGLVGKSIDAVAAGTRVTSQSLTPGTIVAADSPLDLRFGVVDNATLTFKSYPGTHVDLAGRTVASLRAQTEALALTRYALWAPWAVTRTYMSDDELAKIVAFFESLGAKVSPERDKDLESLWRSLVVLASWPYT